MHSRKNYWAAALVSGAAVFACPAWALQCLEPNYVDGKHPISDIAYRMSIHANKRISEAAVIFKGHIETVKHIRSKTDDDLFLVTYKVSEWKRGRSKPKARMLYLPWCDGECRIDLISKDLETFNQDRYYTIKHTTSMFRHLPKLKDIDGVTHTCEIALSKLPLNVKAEYSTSRFSRSFGQFLYDLLIAEELEWLPSRIVGGK